MRARSVPFLLACLLLPACDGGQDQPTALPPGPSAPATTSAPPTPAASTTTPAPTSTGGGARSPIRWLGPVPAGEAARVQLAARRYWSMVVRLAERPDPADPELEALSLPPQRDDLIKLFTTNAASGVTQRGGIDGTVSVRTVTGSSATVMSCLDLTFVRVYDRGGRARPGSSGGVEPFTVELRKEAGSWKVVRASGGAERCTIPR